VTRQLWTNSRADTVTKWVEVGQHALGAPRAISEEMQVRITANSLGEIHEWPDPRMRVAVVDSADGSIRFFERTHGVPIERVLAASSAVPGAWRPSPSMIVVHGRAGGWDERRWGHGLRSRSSARAGRRSQDGGGGPDASFARESRAGDLAGHRFRSCPRPGSARSQPHTPVRGSGPSASLDDRGGSPEALGVRRYRPLGRDRVECHHRSVPMALSC